MNCGIDRHGQHPQFSGPAVPVKTQLLVEPINGLQVKVANGESINNYGRCTGVSFNLQGTFYIADFYILTLGGCDAVLGVQ